ncbi:MAG: ABC transporter ATP-binding protein [Ilumatobacter sp.]|nr:ABC transporter ATP-binding protein [Ilumatobacter sp.]
MTSGPDTRPPGTGGRAHAGPGAVVVLDGVTVTYHDDDDEDVVHAVQEATLQIRAGAITSLLGPSGCGKTSLLRAIAGLERPRAGTISIGGAVVSSVPPRGAGVWVHPERRSVGMVFQDGALFPHLTVAQNVSFGLRSSGRKLSRAQRAERVADMLALVDLTGFADRLPGTLSGGQQQRVALARSLAPQPSVLLLDEPFSALDAALRIQVRAEVARIVRDVGVTTIFVTHDQDEAFVLGDEVVVLRDGHVEQVGTPDAIYRHPNTPWIAGFVGEANFLRGTVDIASPHHADTPLGAVPITHPERVRAAADVDIAVAVDVLVRPEQIVIDRGTDDSHASGHVSAVEYYGHDVRYEVELDDGSVVAARTQVPDLLHDGQRVRLVFDGHPVEAWPVGPAD